MKKQIIKNLASNYLANFVGLILGFILIPFLIQKLGKDSFGMIVLAESSIAFFEMATIGVKMALARFATFSLAQNKDKEFIEFLSTGRAILYGMSVLTFAAASVLSIYFPKILTVPEHSVLQTQMLVFLLGTAFSVSIPNIVHWAVLYAKHRYDLINAANSFGLIFRAASLFALYSWLPAKYVTLSTYGLVYLTMALFQCLAVYRWRQKIMPNLPVHVKHFSLEKVRHICSFGSYSMLGWVNTMIYQTGSNIIINLFWGPLYNAIYSIATKFPSIMTRLFAEASYSLTSTFNDMAARNEREKIRYLYFGATKSLAIVTAPICVLLMMLSGPIIRMWVGPGFEPAAKLLPVLMIPLFLQIPLSVSGCLINSYGCVRVPSLLGLANALLNMALGVLFGHYFSYGLMGIAVGSTLTYVTYSVFFTPFYVCRMAGLPAAAYIKEALAAPILFAVGFTAGGCYIAQSALITHPISFGIPYALLAAVLYLVSAYFALLNPVEKDQVRQVFEKLNQFRRNRGILAFMGAAS